MSFLKKIQEKLGRFTLKKEEKRLKRSVKTFSIEKATSIGVLYNATNRNEEETVKNFIQSLKKETKEVLALGFINIKDSSKLINPILNYTFIDQTNLSNSFIPKGDDVEKFIKKPFSILIDLTTEDCFPLEYISTLSHAKFKVGAKGFYRNNVCDLIIDIDKNRTRKFLLTQIKHYLSMIKN